MIASFGITHCRRCGSSLNMTEFGYCKACEEEMKEVNRKNEIKCIVREILREEGLIE